MTPLPGRTDVVCEFCEGKPVANAATWQDGQERPPCPCPRCGETNLPDANPDWVAAPAGPRRNPSVPLVMDPAGPQLITREGELVPLVDADTAHIADVRDTIRDLESQLREAKVILDAEVLSRMDRQAKWTIQAGVYKLTSSSPAPQDHYDAPALHRDLTELVRQGILSEEARDAAVQQVVDYKPRAAGINALVKLGGLAADTVAQHHHQSDRVRRVSVKRAA